MSPERFTLTGVTVHPPMARAVRVSRDLGNGRGEEWYFPLSHVVEMHHMEGRIVVSAWIAKHKNLR